MNLKEMHSFSKLFNQRFRLRINFNIYFIQTKYPIGSTCYLALIYIWFENFFTTPIHRFLYDLPHTIIPRHDN